MADEAGNPWDLRDPVPAAVPLPAPSDVRDETPRPPAEGIAASSHGGGDGLDAVDDGGCDDLWCARRPLTDLGNAERMHRRVGRDICYTMAAGWKTWDGRRWKEHLHGKVPHEVRMMAFDVVRAIKGEADAVAMSGEDPVVDQKGRGEKKDDVFLSDLLFAWARTSESRDKIGAMIDLFQAMVTVAEDRFDLDPLMLNVANGTLRFVEEAGRWRVMMKPHDRADWISKVSPVEWNPAALCPEYDRFLEAMQPDPNVRAFLHRWQGLSLLGLKVQKMVQFYGTGANGKGTMMELHAHVAGDYAGTINVESLLGGNQRSGQGPSPDIAKLPGIRMLRVTEPDEGATLAEALVKRLTGGDPIDARNNYGPFFTFKPIFKLSFQTNYKLTIRGNDHGIWRRMRLLAWDQTIPDEQADPSFPERVLIPEAAGVLRRLVEGALQYLEHGLAEPDAVIAATADYRDDSDPTGKFLKLCTRPAPGNRVAARDMHRLFAAWAVWAGQVDRAGRPWSEKALATKLQTARVRRVKSGSMWWLDLELVRTPDEFIDHEGNPRADFVVPEVGEDVEMPPEPPVEGQAGGRMGGLPDDWEDGGRVAW